MDTMDQTRQTILVDFDTILHDPPAVKEQVIDYITAHPECLISVINANEGSTEQDTAMLLRILSFPSDVIVVNPLHVDSAPIVFKTMFASRVAEQPGHTVRLVLDDDVWSQQMWSDAGLGEKI